MSIVRLDYSILGALARDLISDPGKHLTHLQGVSIVPVFVSGWKGDKEFQFGRVSMKSHLAAVALQGMLREGEEIECDNSEKCFLIEVNLDLWRAISNPDSGFKPEEAEARMRQGMYHLLLHCNVHPDTQALMTSQPDTRIFSEEVSVWGEDSLSLKAIMTRLKNRPAEDSLLQSLYLTPGEWTRAQAVEGVEPPKRNFRLGKGKDVLCVGGEAFLIFGTKTDEGGRFREAVRVAPWEEVHALPELPFDTRFTVPGMQVETLGVSWDDPEGQDVEPTPGRWVIVETGYRLLEPEYGVKPPEDTLQTNDPEENKNLVVTLSSPGRKDIVLGESEPSGALVIKVADDENLPLADAEKNLSDAEWEKSAKRLGIREGDTLGLPEPVGALAGVDAAAGRLL